MHKGRKSPEDSQNGQVNKINRISVSYVPRPGGVSIPFPPPLPPPPQIQAGDQNPHAHPSEPGQAADDRNYSPSSAMAYSIVSEPRNQNNVQGAARILNPRMGRWFGGLVRFVGVNVRRNFIARFGWMGREWTIL